MLAGVRPTGICEPRHAFPTVTRPSPYFLRFFAWVLRFIPPAESCGLGCVVCGVGVGVGVVVLEGLGGTS